jgi:hypothetical protein
MTDIRYWTNSRPVFSSNSHSFLVCRSAYTETLFFMVQRRVIGQGFLTVEDSRSHSDPQRSVWLRWTNDRSVAEVCTWQHNTHKTETPMPLAGFEPTVPTSERLQTHRPSNHWDRLTKTKFWNYFSRRSLYAVPTANENTVICAIFLSTDLQAAV